MPQKSKLLWLPESSSQIAPPSFQIAGEYLSLGDLTGAGPCSSAELLRLLGTMRRSDVICLAACVLEAVTQNSDARTQLELVATLLEPDIAAKIRNAVDAKSRWAVFHRRQIWLLLQMAFIACSEKDAGSANPDILLKATGKALMMTSDLLQQTEASQMSMPESADDSLKWLITLLVSHSELPTTNDVLARAHCFWFESLADPTVRQAFERLNLGADFDALFRSKYGLPLTEFFFVAASFYFVFLSSAVKRPISASLLDSTTDSAGLISDTDKKAALGLLSTNVDKMAARLLGAPRQSWALDYSPLMKYPLLEVFQNKYACPDLSHFRLFFVDGIFWLLAEAAATPEWRKFFGVVYEWYITRLISSFGVTSTGLVRTFYPSPKFRGTEDQVCDGLLVWQQLAVLCEYKSNRFTSRQRSGSAMDETIKAIEDTAGDKGAVGQLARSIQRILSGATVVVGNSAADFTSCKLVVPAIIWYEEAAGNHAIRNYLQERLTKRLEDLKVDSSRVGPLVLLTTGEMELFEHLARKMSAEQLLQDYVQLIRQHPRDPASAFHVYAHIKFKEQTLPRGFVGEKLEAVLTGLQAKHAQRMATPPSSHEA